ncbi:DUF47 domain-containing protein [Clostridium massiliamazoniense]|uniref:DUF47 domain-containing protein n=1 Tax=Clostridium massiliamazoniense TaxID=1347366 RepID=UPI0006D788F6|nr:DUF47 family protein [Clostridium massiliamazoniense]
MFNGNRKEDKFYVKLREQASNIVEGARVLNQYINDIENSTIYVQQIKEIENKGDKIVHSIIELLNNSFVTPIDREDIYMVTKRMDDIIDNIETIVHRFVMFNILSSTEESKIFINLVIRATEEIEVLMSSLSYMNKSKEGKIINEKIIEVNKIENEGDLFFREVVGSLFRNKNIEVLDVIKWKDIYQVFENTLDACENVANIIGGVVTKHA